MKSPIASPLNNKKNIYNKVPEKLTKSNVFAQYNNVPKSCEIKTSSSTNLRLDNKETQNRTHPKNFYNFIYAENLKKMQDIVKKNDMPKYINEIETESHDQISGVKSALNNFYKIIQNPKKSENNKTESSYYTSNQSDRYEKERNTKYEGHNRSQRDQTRKTSHSDIFFDDKNINKVSENLLQDELTLLENSNVISRTLSSQNFNNLPNLNTYSLTKRAIHKKKCLLSDIGEHSNLERNKLLSESKKTKDSWSSRLFENTVNLSARKETSMEQNETISFSNKRLINFDENADLISSIGKTIDNNTGFGTSRSNLNLPVSEFSKYKRPMFYPFSSPSNKATIIGQFRLDHQGTQKKHTIDNMIDSNKEQFNTYKCYDINEEVQDYDNLVSKVKLNQKALKIQPRMHLAKNINGKINLKKSKNMVTLNHSVNPDNCFTESTKDIKKYYVGERECLTYTYKGDHVNNYFYPEAREGATIIYDRDKSYYFGGLGTKCIENLCFFDHTKMIWKEIKVNKEQNGKNIETSITNVCPSSYHISILYKDSIIMFGGEKNDNIFNTVWAFDLNFYSWNVKHTVGEIVEPRKCHVGCLAGANTIFIHGGQDTNNNVLDSYYILNQITGRWFHIKLFEAFKSEKNNLFETESEKSPFLFYHTAVSCVNTRSISNYREDPRLNFDSAGVWMFGGKNKKGLSTNDLWHVRLSERNCKFTLIKPKGKAPKERFSHKMISLPHKNYIVIIGGRNDEIYESKGHNCFDDINILDYNKLVWINVKPRGESYVPRYSFCATMTGYSIFVVGGISDGTLLEQTPYQILFDVEDKLVRTFDAVKDKFENAPLLKQKFAKLFGSDIIGKIFSQASKGLAINQARNQMQPTKRNAINKTDSQVDMKENNKHGIRKINTMVLDKLSPLAYELEKLLKSSNTEYDSFIPNPNDKLDSYFQGRNLSEDDESED